MTFAMQCPECEADVDEIEATVSSGRRTEEFWGASVQLDESECEIELIPPCPDCGKVTIDAGAAAEFYWDRVA